MILLNEATLHAVITRSHSLFGQIVDKIFFILFLAISFEGFVLSFEVVLIMGLKLMEISLGIKLFILLGLTQYVKPSQMKFLVVSYHRQLQKPKQTKRNAQIQNASCFPLQIKTNQIQNTSYQKNKSKNLIDNAQQKNLLIFDTSFIIQFIKINQEKILFKSYLLVKHCQEVKRQIQIKTETQSKQKNQPTTINRMKTIQFVNVLALVLLIIESVFALETTILEDLNRADQESLLLARQLSNVLKDQIYINDQRLTCLTILPSNFTKNTNQKVHKLNLTINFQNQFIKNAKKAQQEKSAQKQVIGSYEDYDYEKILDLLHGSCAIHETNEFHYEYCHKQKVRQFDTILTKQRMAKSNYQDISLGHFNYQKAIHNSQNERDSVLRQQNQAYKVKYTQNGDYTVLSAAIQKMSFLSQKEKMILKQSFKQEGVHPETSQGSGTSQSIQDQQGGAQNIKILKPNHLNNLDVSNIIIQTIPMRTVVHDKDNLFSVFMVNHKEYELDKINKVVHLNFPIVSNNRYFLQSEYSHDITCNYQLQGRKNVYVAKGTVVSPFELIFQGDPLKCDRIIQVSGSPVSEKIHNTPFYVPKLRGSKHFLYGHVEQACSRNWDWSMNNANEFVTERENFLEKGTTLLLGVTANNSQYVKTKHFHVTIQEIIAPGVVRMKQDVGQMINPALHKNLVKQVWISSCRIISKSPLKSENQIMDVNILNHNIVKIKKPQKQAQKNPGDRILCLCQFKQYVEQYLEMELTIGKKLVDANQGNQFYSYYQFYQKVTVKAYSQKGQSLNKICSALICYDVLQKPQIQPIHNPEKNEQTTFNQITKLTARNRVLSQDLETENTIFIIDLFGYGIVKIHTQSEEGEKYFYLITSFSILKIRLYPNNTKQVVKENPYYQNQTRINYQSWLGDSIMIHKNYIWRGNDKVIFPRLDFINQRITSIERVSGVAYVRKWNLENMKNKQSTHMVSNIKKIIKKHFTIKNYPIYKAQHLNAQTDTTANQNINQLINQAKNEQAKNEQSQQTEDINVQKEANQEKKNKDFSKIDFSESYFKPLNQSVLLRYQYFHGDYCGQPINKNRRTNVYLSCGQSWLRLQQVGETSPCIYEFYVSTRLLCKQNYTKVVDKIQKLVQSRQSRVRLKKSTICYPQDAWDSVQFSYDIDRKEVIYEEI